MKKIAWLAFVFFVAASGIHGQQRDEVQERLKALEERIRALETELAALKSAQAAPAPAEPVAAAVAQAPPVAPGAVPAQLPVYGGAAAGMSKVFNPDISVVGNFLGAAGGNPIRPVPALELSEAEAGFQAVIDPYARGDIFLAFGPEGVELEEAYLTFTSLPFGLVAKAGKMRAAFGRVNTFHAHNLPWTDRPLVTENLLGGEEGISDSGVSLSRILPAPKNIFLEGTAQLYRGESADVFAPERRGDLTLLGRLRGYGDLSESTNVEMGFSYARGKNENGSDFLTQLYGLDATLRWKPLRRAIYRSFLLRTELVWSHREEPALTQRAFGLYTAGEYRLNRRWTAGARYDRSGRARDASLTDRGFSALLTYWPSEFSQLRGQYRFGRYAEGRDAHEFRFQLLFSMGAHGAHPF